MGRFLGLSGFSNPIDAGIDSYAKIQRVFQDQNDSKIREMEAQDRHADSVARREQADRKLQWEEEDRPAQVAVNQATKMKAEHEVIHPHITSAIIKNEQARQSGTLPEYSPEEIDSILHLNKEAPLLDDDPEVAMGQVSALHNLQQTMAQVTPALMQHAQQLPEGQRKVRISDQNAPGVVDSFNVAFSKLLKGKKADSFLVDMDKGTIIPVVVGEDGKPEPMTKNVDKKGWDKRADGSQKGTGWLGVMKRPDGKVSSEISVGVEIDDKDIDIPTMVPGLSKQELDYLLNTDRKNINFKSGVGKEIMGKAIEHAKGRIEEGKSPFADDSETPANGGKEINAIPLKLMQNYITKGAAFGNLLLPALAQTDAGGDKLLEQVQKAGQARELAQAKAKVLNSIPDKATTAEKRKLYTKGMGEAGHSVTPAEAKELFDDSEEKELRRERFQLELQDKKDTSAEKRQMEHDATIIRAVSMRHSGGRGRGGDRSDKEQKRYDKLLKENISALQRSSDWKNEPFESIRGEAERITEQQISGKSAEQPKETSAARARRLAPLKESFKNAKTGFLGIGGVDQEYLLNSARSNRWSDDDIREASRQTPMSDTVDNYDFKQPVKSKTGPEKHNEASSNTGKSSSKTSPARTQKGDGVKTFDSKPPAGQFKGRTIKEPGTGKRYKSNGKQWVELPSAV